MSYVDFISLFKFKIKSENQSWYKDIAQFYDKNSDAFLIHLFLKRFTNQFKYYWWDPTKDHKLLYSIF